MENSEAISALCELKSKIENGVLGYYDEEAIEALDMAISIL